MDGRSQVRDVVNYLFNDGVAVVTHPLGKEVLTIAPKGVVVTQNGFNRHVYTPENLPPPIQNGGTVLIPLDGGGLFVHVYPLFSGDVVDGVDAPQPRKYTFLAYL